jgi:hypothetical protein
MEINMSKSSQAVKDWRVRTKARILEAMGGKCNLCGYNKCNAALELHHINPENKEISFGGIRANPVSWEKIVDELKKCVLLCANCHREVESGVVVLPNNIKTFDEKYTEYKAPPVVYKNSCNNCKKSYVTKEKNKKYCSADCWAIANRKVNRPLKKELKTLIEQHTWVAIGKMFNVSDNAVRNWAKQYGLL